MTINDDNINIIINGVIVHMIVQIGGVRDGFDYEFCWIFL